MKQTFLLIVAIALLGCSSHHHDNMELTPPAVVPESVQVSEEYKIGVNDQLQISVWKHPELSIAVAVRPDGKISVPLIGDLSAAGVTAEDLAETVEESLKNYIRTPQVTVIVSSANSALFLRRISVTGAVNSPRSVIHQQGITVFDAVLQAGGLSAFARANDAKLYRKDEDGTIKIYPIRLRDILENGRLETNYPLVPSDIISVPERVF